MEYYPLGNIMQQKKISLDYAGLGAILREQIRTLIKWDVFIWKYARFVKYRSFYKNYFYNSPFFKSWLKLWKEIRRNTLLISVAVRSFREISLNSMVYKKWSGDDFTFYLQINL